jgi:hypothetical protein
MDSKSDEIISSLRQKIKTVVGLYEEEKGKAESFRMKNLELSDRVEILEKKMEETDKKYENLKIAKVLSSVPGEDLHDTKLQVNRIVREIDKCIALLNR